MSSRHYKQNKRVWSWSTVLFQLQVWINPINESSKASKQASYPTEFAWGKRRGSEISASISAPAALSNPLHCPGRGWHWSIVQRCLKENSDVRTDLDVGVWRVGKLFLPRRAGPTNYTWWCISQVHVNCLNTACTSSGVSPRYAVRYTRFLAH